MHSTWITAFIAVSQARFGQHFFCRGCTAPLSKSASLSRTVQLNCMAAMNRHVLAYCAAQHRLRVRLHREED